MMTIHLYTDGFNADKRLETAIHNKLGAIQRHIHVDSICNISLTKTNFTKSVNISVTAPGQNYRATAEGESIYGNLDSAISKIIKQILKDKEKRVDAKENFESPKQSDIHRDL